MHPNRFLSIKILYIFFYIVQTSLCKKLTLSDFKKIVSRSDSKDWLINSLNTTNSTNSYCRLCCINISTETIGKHCGSHTLCKYSSTHTGPACKGYIHIQFTTMEKKILLDAHNTLRNNVASGLELRGNPGPQPSAANMRILQWNDELALIAERWAAQCIYSHDVCRDLERVPVGQSIAHGNLATNNELSFIKAWYDEVEHFNKTDVRDFKLSDGHGHIIEKYSQLVWADTYEIGCARAVFQESTGAQVKYRQHFICNYGPTGNIPHQPVYLMGAPCSACHEGTSCTIDYPSLCGDEAIHKENEDVYGSENLRSITRRANDKLAKSGHDISTGSYFLVLYIHIYFLCFPSF